VKISLLLPTTNCVWWSCHSTPLASNAKRGGKASEGQREKEREREGGRERQAGGEREQIMIEVANSVKQSK